MSLWDLECFLGFYCATLYRPFSLLIPPRGFLLRTWSRNLGDKPVYLIQVMTDPHDGGLLGMSPITNEVMNLSITCCQSRPFRTCVNLRGFCLVHKIPCIPLLSEIANY